jgi:hypothetical protein
MLQLFDLERFFDHAMPPGKQALSCFGKLPASLVFAELTVRPRSPPEWRDVDPSQNRPAETFRPGGFVMGGCQPECSRSLL